MELGGFFQAAQFLAQSEGTDNHFHEVAKPLRGGEDFGAFFTVYG